MAIAATHCELLSLIREENYLNVGIMKTNNLKTLALYDAADLNSELAAGKSHLRRVYKAEFERHPELYTDCDSYTDIDAYEEEIDILTTRINQELEEINQYEEFLNRQNMVNSTELEEIKVQEDSLKQTLQSNISRDFAYGLNGG